MQSIVTLTITDPASVTQLTVNDAPVAVTLTVQDSKGEPGASAYDVWLADGNAGTPADFLASIKFNAATDLGQGGLSADTVTVTSSTGTSVTLPAATEEQAGVMSAADKAALRNKQNTLVSGTSIKTFNGESLLGVGDIIVEAPGAGLSLFSESRKADGFWGAVPSHALAPVGDEFDIDAVITPKGGGAFTVQAADGAAAGGGKRGKGAVDLQLSRNSPGQVASGDYTLVIGYGNTASALYAVAIGRLSVASGLYSTSIGGLNVASATYSAALGGGGNAASGVYSVALGGNSNDASGRYSIASGYNTTSRGTIGAISEGVSASRGRAQMSRIPFRWDTAGSAPTLLTTDGTTAGTDNTAVLPNNSAYLCRLRILARNTSTNEARSWLGTALIRRGANAAATALIGSSVASDFGDAAMQGCIVTISADTTRGALAITVTGLAGAAVSWVAQLETVESA